MKRTFCLSWILLYLLLALEVAHPLFAVPISQTFTYDAANRLTAASSNSYNPDLAGNLTAINGPIATAEIALQQQAEVDLTDNGPALNFDSVYVGSTSTSITIFIQNAGNLNLDNLLITKDGANAADFTVDSTQLPTSLVPGSNASFTITFHPSAAGTRVASLHVSNNDPNENPFDLNLTGNGLSTLTALENWRQTHFGTSENSGNAADLSDPDHDGIQNLMEFAFGLHPLQSSANLLPQPQFDGTHLSLSFTKPETVSGIAYGAESSTTLLQGSWISVPNSGTFPHFIFSLPSGSEPRLFMRLKVSPLTPPPPPPPLPSP